MTTSATSDVSPNITEDDINKAQEAWCKGLVEISTAYRDKLDYKWFANNFLDRLYDFEEGRVFFRPTLAMAPQNFRTTRAGALAYFIGEDPDFPNDKGFAKLPWISATYDNEIEGKDAVQIHGNIAIVMGNVYLRQQEVTVGGKEVVVDKVFVYRKDSAGTLRLIVHNSAVSNIPDTEVPEDNAK
ncbi:MAG TPA: hypothetical protein VIT88_09870 [Pyrinomonadaceae bacterium]